MIICDDARLKRGRESGLCEICLRPCRVREFHHWKPKGMGGGSRLDVAINLIDVGSTRNFECHCHTQCESGLITQGHVLGLIAKRHRVKPISIQHAIWVLLRMGDERDAPKELADETPEVVHLVMEALAERSIGK